MHSVTTPGTRRITISVPQTIAAEAERAVEEHRAPSVSAYFAAAAARTERADTLAALAADLVAEWGPPSEQAEAWADTIFGEQA